MPQLYTSRYLSAISRLDPKSQIGLSGLSRERFVPFQQDISRFCMMQNRLFFCSFL